MNLNRAREVEWHQALAAERAMEIAETIVSEKPIIVGDVEIHPQGFVAFYRGQDVGLVAKEMKVVTLLAARPSWTFTRDQIADFIGLHHEADDRCIDSHMKRIRSKFSAVSEGKFNPITTIYGVGYRWNAPQTPRAVGMFKSCRAVND